MKYLRTFLLALQVEIQYQINIILWIIVGLVPTSLLILVWLSILGKRSNIQGFTKGDFIIYYFFMTIGWYIVGGVFRFMIGDAIRNGDISKSLVKPYDVILEQVLKEQSWKTLSLLTSFPFVIGVLYFFRSSIHISLSFDQVILLILSLTFGAMNFGFIEAMVGLTGFWITDVWPAGNIFEILTALFGGRLVPLTLMPVTLRTVSNILPFKYIFYVPVSLILHKSLNPYFDVGIQSLYALILLLLYKIVWHFAIRRYEANGG